MTDREGDRTFAETAEIILQRRQVERQVKTCRLSALRVFPALNLCK
ncbi:hypothetical protein [Microcoleus sp. herbarium12]